MMMTEMEISVRSCMGIEYEVLRILDQHLLLLELFQF